MDETGKDLLIEVPGKTFLAGEYLALMGGPSLVVATGPHFLLWVRRRGKNSRSDWQHAFHEKSPAGRLIAKNLEFFKQFDMGWQTPTAALGFGSSTAEFAALSILFQMRDSLWIEEERHLDFSAIHRSYRELASDEGAKWPPSGADLIGQMRGGITCLDAKKGQIQSYGWPFENIGFCLFKTGMKIPTHEHLQSLGDFEIQGLQAWTGQLLAAIQNIDEAKWIDGIRGLAIELEALNFVCDNTMKMISSLSCPYFLALKGCGALGADVIAGYYLKKDKNQVFNILKQNGIEVSATEADISAGFAVNVFDLGAEYFVRNQNLGSGLVEVQR